MRVSVLQPRLWAGSATVCWRGTSVWQIVWLLFLSGSLHCLIAKWHNSPSPLVWCLQQTSTRCSLNYSSSDTVHITQHILGTRIINFDLVNLPVSCPPSALCVCRTQHPHTLPLFVSHCALLRMYTCVILNTQLSRRSGPKWCGQDFFQWPKTCFLYSLYQNFDISCQNTQKQGVFK